MGFYTRDSCREMDGVTSPLEIQTRQFAIAWCQPVYSSITENKPSISDLFLVGSNASYCQIRRGDARLIGSEVCVG